MPYPALSPLTAISPIDGRYATKTEALRDSFSEYGLIRYRVLVEVKWLKYLSEHPQISEISPFSDKANQLLDGLVDNFSIEQAQQVKKLKKQPIMM